MPLIQYSLHLHTGASFLDDICIRYLLLWMTFANVVVLFLPVTYNMIEVFTLAKQAFPSALASSFPTMYYLKKIIFFDVYYNLLNFVFSVFSFRFPMHSLQKNLSFDAYYHLLKHPTHNIYMGGGSTSANKSLQILLQVKFTAMNFLSVLSLVCYFFYNLVY